MSNQNPEANPADPTDVHDRAMPDGGTATDAPPATQTYPRWDANSSSQSSPVPAAVGAGVVALLLAYVIRKLKARHLKPTPSERLADATKTLGTASVKLGDRAGDRLGDVAEQVKARAPGVASKTADVAGDVAEQLKARAPGVASKTADIAGDVAGEVRSRAPEVASRAAAVAGDVADYVTSRAPDVASKTADVASQVAGVASDVGGKAVSAAQRAGGGVGDVGGAIAGGAEHVYDRTTTWANRLLLLLIGFIGYVLGAAAGRERYEQIAGVARSVASRPEVQQAKDKVQQTVQEQTGLGGGASSGSSAT
jgi:hypothetical protein